MKMQDTDLEELFGKHLCHKEPASRMCLELYNSKEYRPPYVNIGKSFKRPSRKHI